MDPIGNVLQYANHINVAALMVIYSIAPYPVLAELIALIRPSLLYCSLVEPLLSFIYLRKGDVPNIEHTFGLEIWKGYVS